MRLCLRASVPNRRRCHGPRAEEWPLEGGHSSPFVANLAASLLGRLFSPPATTLARCLRVRTSQGALRIRLRLLASDELVALGCDSAQTTEHAAGTGRDEAADDHVLLQALERIDLAVHGGLGQHARGLLEGRR